MNVQLYIYDLSGGLARNLSATLLGIQIDAIYHTGIVMGGIEYTYDGGIKTLRAGTTHLGQPMQVVELGQTHLPMEIIMEYLESLSPIYTAEAYDIWSHNCMCFLSYVVPITLILTCYKGNNFSNDFATFLLGKGIPSHITNLPQTVLNTPFGRMIQPQIEKMVQDKRKRSGGGLLGISNAPNVPKTHLQVVESVRKPNTSHELEKLLAQARKSCAVIFFTSATCPPCKTIYPVFEELAAETGSSAVLIVVDISRSYEIGTKYDVRATPTFMTFLHGQVENRWNGADPNTLRGNVRLLVQQAWPPHPHESLALKELRASNTKPNIYGKLPPLEKLQAKMGPSVANDPAVVGVMNFVSSRDSQGAAETTLPNVDRFSKFLRSAPSKLPAEILFTIVDLLRVALIDPRFSGYYAEETNHNTIAPLISHISSLKDCPYSLRLVTLQMACNLFSTPLYPQHILGCSALTQPIIQLITTSLLDDKHHNTRVAAASLTFNITSANSKYRTEEHRDLLPEAEQIELAASLLEAIEVEEESAEALKGFLLAFGYLVYCMPKDGELVDLLKTMAAQDMILGKKKLFPKEPLLQEVGETILGTGL